MKLFDPALPKPKKRPVTLEQKVRLIVRRHRAGLRRRSPKIQPAPIVPTRRD